MSFIHRPDLALFNLYKAGVVVCTCNTATLEAKFWNDVGSMPVGGNSPSIGGWTV